MTSESSPREAVTRREWIRNGLLFAGAAAAGAAASGISAAILDYLLPPPVGPVGSLDESMVFAPFPTAQWWNHLAGQPVKVTDFQNIWDGATAVWRGLFQNGQWVAGTGYPVVLIRTVRDSAYYHLPSSASAGLPLGFNFFYDDPTRDIRIVALFDRCTHLCCYPGWHVVSNPPPSTDYSTYGTYSPTYEVYSQLPIYCICHGGEYDPLLLTSGTNPTTQSSYVGADWIYGPVDRPLPLIPLNAVDDVLYGGMADPRWYAYC